MISNLPWKIYSLEMDSDGKEIGDFFQSKGYDITKVNPLEGTNEDLEDHQENGVSRDKIEKLVSNVISSDNRVLALMSDGHQHHLTYGLCKLADMISEKYGYIHIDNHPDDGSQFYWADQGIITRFSKNGLTPDHSIVQSGYFVDQITKFTNAAKNDESWKKVLSIGVGDSLGISFSSSYYQNRKDPRSHVEEDLKKLGDNLDNLPEEVYVSIDLDVLKQDEIRTTYSTGVMILEELKEVINQIQKKKKIIGATIIGYSMNHHDSSSYRKDIVLPTFEKSMGVYSNLIDSLLKK